MLNKAQNKDKPEELEVALRKAIEPLVELALKFGYTEKRFAELVRDQYVFSASKALGADSKSRVISQIATMTSLTRREVVSRLKTLETAERVETHSVIGTLYSKWHFQKPWCTVRRKPKRLQVKGDGLSFESLCKDLTQDVHPASLLRELKRLKMVSLDATGRFLTLESCLPQAKSDATRYLGDNLRAHAKACVQNITERQPQHFEQVIFADELSKESAAQLKFLLESRWKELLEHFVPLASEFCNADKREGVANTQIRIGVYSYSEEMPSGSEGG
jgi:hypothetical protein